MPRPASSASPTPTVVIVDADRRVQASLADLLGVSGDVRVVGTAGDVRAALECVGREQPDAVLVDPRLPDVEAGMALVGGLRRAWPGVRVVLTGWGDVTGHGIGPAEDLPYVSKSTSPEGFAGAIVDACCAVASRPRRSGGS